MKGSNYALMPLRVFRMLTATVCFGVPLWLSAAGCADHRITLNEFLLRQEELRQDSAATQPSVPKRTASQPVLEAMINQSLGRYKVGPFDVVGISFVTTDQASQPPPFQVRVDQNGKMLLPPEEKIEVAGLDLVEVGEAIRKAYIPNILRDAAVLVQLIEPESTNVLVVGAVTDPGLVRLRRTERNLLFAIVAAGGVSEMASGRVTLKRIRRPDEEVTLKLTDPEELRGALALDPLESGDIVTVHAATPNMVFVGGLVNAPSPQTYPQGVKMTILQAIAAAGGLRTDVIPREATLIRRTPNGKEVQVRLDLERIGTGRDPNIQLAAGDILWVPHTAATRVQEWINQNIFVRGGFSANVNYNVSGIEWMNRASQQSAGLSGNDAGSEFDPLGFLNRGAALRTLGR